MPLSSESGASPAHGFDASWNAPFQNARRMRQRRMTDSQRNSVESLLHEAKHLSPAERSSFLANIDDEAVRAEVASLLAADSKGRDIGAILAEAAGKALSESSTGQV